MNFDHYQYIVVEGPVGVGKTSLAHRIALAFEAHTLLEQPQDNPFLERFYRDAARYALPTQLSFLFQRVNQLSALTHTDLSSTRVVSDFLMEKDAMFARLTLDDDELKLYQQMHDNLSTQGPLPDLVIYLQAQPETLADRIRKRGVAMETGMSEKYIHRLCDSYSHFFYHYDVAPLLIVNTEHLNPVDSDEDFELLLTRIRNMRGRREFFSRGE